MSITRHDLIASSPVAWILDGKFITENGKPIEFVHHKFLIDYLSDEHPDICAPKAAQIGATVAETLQEIHDAKFKGRNTIHTLQNADVIRGFVVPKVNPIIYNNPEIKALLVKDSENLKQFGDGFVFYRGAQAESQAINISADTLKIDEGDRSAARVVEMFQSRLDASDWRRKRYLSNPSAIGFGVDALWQKSNQFHWMVKCSHCNHTMYLDWEHGDTNNHYIDRVQRIYACGKCGGEIYDVDRMTGFWWPAWASRTDRHGYWFSQLMVSWFSAADIIKKFEDNSIDYFHNFVLGKAYTPSDMRIDRESILKNVKPTQPLLKNVVMGTDVGKPHWYWLATPNGYFRYGKTDSWEELEYLFKFYQCEAWVIDAMPEFTQVQRMINKYRGKVWGCYFLRDSKNVGAIRWGEGDKRGLVYVDRTKALDRYVTELTSHTMPFFIKEDEMEEYIGHAANMYRAVETDEKGGVKVDWKTTEGKPDHLVFAGLYSRIALERVFNGSGAGVVETEPRRPNASIAPVLNRETEHKTNIEVTYDIQASINKAMRDK